MLPYISRTVKAFHMQFSAKALYTFRNEILFPFTGSGRNNALFPPIFSKVMKIAHKLAIKQNLDEIIRETSRLNFKY